MHELDCITSVATFTVGLKDEKGNLVPDSHSSLARWSNHFSHLLKIHGINDVSQTELHTAEPLLPKPSDF